MAVQTLSLERLRIHAISRSLFPETTLKAAIDHLGFVQADPIRSPARAQDLILRHRVNGYRAGDLERLYSSLDVEEDYFYAYGFVSRNLWQFLHPRKAVGLRVMEKRVLDVVRRIGQTHPKALEAHLGRRRVVNAWGGRSKHTTRALDHLHHRGHLRIARRDNGIRVYELPASGVEALTPATRLRKIALVMANIFAPAPQKSLQSAIVRYRYLGNAQAVVPDLIRTGELQREMIDGTSYVWPAGANTPTEIPRVVRFLAPFDPVVWDRKRFEHLWGWSYRFEAYTPAARRVRGYYAMPLLWRDSIVGWANAGMSAGRVKVDVGFVSKRPREADFRQELDAEIARLERFLRS